MQDQGKSFFVTHVHSTVVRNQQVNHVELKTEEYTQMRDFVMRISCDLSLRLKIQYYCIIGGHTDFTPNITFTDY